MAISSVSWEFAEPVPAVAPDVENWYGLQTRSRHEKIVAQRLEEKGVTTFLPLVTEVHRWSDRKKSVEVPLFSCYVFAKFVPNRTDRLRVLRVDGVFGLVGSKGEGAPIPEEQMAAVRNVVEGILVSRNGDRTLVISVDAIQRSLAVRVEGYEVEPV